ncbi:hypothetical protein EVAR_67456_1 [Eumeta japonica]|uniref:Uncharacterized protein n=1 Tax=Eumeta variegata TaxID=151549 RepID=A0A4C1T044_EUMVA|nr:hypothetical protein EVAR_67456_1 [Eumeta japonica]
MPHSPPPSWSSLCIAISVPFTITSLVHSCFFFIVSNAVSTTHPPGSWPHTLSRTQVPLFSKHCSQPPPSYLTTSTSSSTSIVPPQYMEAPLETLSAPRATTPLPPRAWRHHLQLLYWSFQSTLDSVCLFLWSLGSSVVIRCIAFSHPASPTAYEAIQCTIYSSIQKRHLPLILPLKPNRSRMQPPKI